MMRYRLPSFLLVLVLATLAGCGGDSPTAPKTYTDSLTLGTGIKGDSLTGQTTTFTFTGETLSIFWRVESSEKLQGSDVEIEIEKQTDFGWEQVHNAVFQLVDYEDYVAISSYFHTYGTGRFRALGYVAKPRRLVGTVEFTVLPASGN